MQKRIQLMGTNMTVSRIDQSKRRSTFLSLVHFQKAKSSNMTSSSTSRLYREVPYVLSNNIHTPLLLCITSLELNTLPSMECYITIELFSDTTCMHTVSCSTCRFPRLEDGILVWKEWISIPIKYCDLSLSSFFLFTIYDDDGKKVIIKQTSLSCFEKGTLRMGCFALALDSANKDENENDSGNENDFGKSRYDNMKWKMEKDRERYDGNGVLKNEWLDKLSFKEMSEMEKRREKDGQDILWIELPIFQVPMVYEEEVYIANRGIMQLVQDAQEHVIPGKEENVKEILGQDGIYDPEIHFENPVEWKYRKLTRGIIRGGTVVDQHIKPNREELGMLQAIMDNPNDLLNVMQRDLIWKFRYYLTRFSKAVTKFLLSVDWTDESEIKQVVELLQAWNKKAPIDIADALKLLGRQKEYKHEIVRQFAVATISKARDDELQDYLLQLVQALRYDHQGAHAVENTSPSNSIGPLAKFLISRACRQHQLANYFYWYLKVELDDPMDGAIFRTVFRTMVQEMKKNPKSNIIYEMLSAQDDLFSKIQKYHNAARAERGRKEQKEEYLQTQLKEIVWNKGTVIRMPLEPSLKLTGFVIGSTKIFKSALYPAVIEFKAEEVIDEATSDATLDKKTLAKRPKVSRVASLFGREASKTSYKVMFKSGDDLRQDQLIMQMFILMDRLLKKVNLDLKLTPYRILAKSTSDGLMEFVLDSQPVSQVVANYESPQILSFLRQHNPDQSAEFGVAPEALNTYVKSVAGYCVLTYLLAIGDRHLDNLMLKTKGHLFHIDFGCIFGRDPKPYPPPFKLTKEMVEGMGGVSSEHYAKFKTYCCQAYNWLRRSAPLILNLLNLMVDAGIDELSSDPVTTLAKIQEKFRLDLTDEQAEQFFLGLINDSVTSLFPVLMEYIHKVATKLR